MSDTGFGSLIAIAGGIGSGKSMVARIVAAMGFEVYDCDLRARRLMEAEAMKAMLADEFGSEIFDETGRLIRRALADMVFADSGRLEALNAIVHSAVRDDLAAWVSSRSSGKPVFVETAILYQSRIDRMVARVWEVTAPIETRIERVKARNGLSEREVLARIESQDSFDVTRRHNDVEVIVNDGVRPLLPRIESLLQWKKHSSLSRR